MKKSYATTTPVDPSLQYSIFTRVCLDRDWAPLKKIHASSKITDESYGLVMWVDKILILSSLESNWKKWIRFQGVISCAICITIYLISYSSHIFVLVQLTDPVVHWWFFDPQNEFEVFPYHWRRARSQKIYKGIIFCLPLRMKLLHHLIK